MSSDQVLKTCEGDMTKAVDQMKDNFKKVRTGRATTEMFDNVVCDYYGNPTPINQMSTLNATDATTITIKPFEHKLLGDVEKAIQKANLGVTVVNDGVAVRVQVPALNEERRKQLVSEAKDFSEDAKVRARDARRDANKALDGLKKEGASEDDIKKYKADVDALLKQYESQIESVFKDKSDDILSF